MSNKQLVSASKFLSYVLRHEPQAIGLSLDSEGWGSIEALIAGGAQQGHTFSRELVEQVVATSDKKRFELSADGQRIRAVQGHSTGSVAREFEPKQPPDTLFHGTASRFVESIRREGLKPGSRHHVHLSADPQTARSVGQRYGSPVVLVVDAGRMHAQGHVFHQAENGVWLTDAVSSQFLREGTS
ncbi:RNA 2'-phosphotransferase [Aquabacterium sp. A7-Y]|uniref:RNA 2'-phosphotransferase n=1 Tax=Aquabacterium sp. A7-Y TaxID=1349605 RepID=UPI00223DD081|nr:RNA 2'-phosphotransferase [Aquabacterium sp. A7-Y]MCW7542139.1 RNA 2'-phosphotransferase [Aquabacterium sp. A7-Y]